MIPVRLLTRIFLPFLFLSLASVGMYAQVPAGKEFLVVLPAVSQGQERILNKGTFTFEVMAQRDANVKVRWANNGTVLSNTFLPAGSRAVFSKPQFAINQIMQRPEIEYVDIVNKMAFIVTADQPVSVRATFDSSYSTENYSLYPVASWGTDYRLVTYSGLSAKSQRNGFVIMGSQDNTQVTITPNATTYGGTHPAGVPYTVTLNKYDVLQVLTNSPGQIDGDMTGTRIKSDKPVGVISFSQGASVPYVGPVNPPPSPKTCDPTIEPLFSAKAMIEQQAPDAMAGTAFYAMPFSRTPTLDIDSIEYCMGAQTKRRDSSRLRFYVLNDGTKFIINGDTIKQAFKPGNPLTDSTFNAGFLYEVSIAQPTQIVATKPVVGAEFAFSGNDRMSYGPLINVGPTGSYDTLRVPYGDPMMVALPPVSFYKPNLEITIPNVRERASRSGIERTFVYWKHLLIITAPVTALKGVTLNGQPVNFNFIYQDGKYASAMVRVAPGLRQLIESAEPISVMGYGLTWNDSYGTLASEAIRSHGVVAPDTLRFSTCDPQKDTTITVQSTGGGDFRVDSVRFNGINGSVLNPTPAEFPVAMPAGSARKILLRVKTPTPGVYTGSIRVYTDANNKAVFELPFVITRDSAQLAIPATTVDFGVLKAQETTHDTVIVVRNSGARPLVITTIAFAGIGYQLIGGSLPDTLAPGETDSLRIRFTPTLGGLQESVMHIIGTPCLPVIDVKFRGFQGSGGSLLVQRTVGYGSFLCGVPDHIDTTITIRSVGDEPVKILTTGITGAQASEFSLVDVIAGKVIPPGDSLPIHLRYTPGGYNVRRAQLHITTDAKNAPSIDIDLTASRDTVALKIAESALEFGRMLTCDSASEQIITLRNDGTIADTVTSLDLGGAAAYSVTPPLPVILAPGTPVELRVRFAPTSDGVFATTLKLTGAPCGIASEVPLHGERATPQLSVSASSVQFDTTTSCQGASGLTVVLKNDGAVGDTISSLEFGGSAAFSSSTALPLVLAPGESDTVHLIFAPSTEGTHGGTLTVGWSPCGTARLVALSGYAARTSSSVTGGPVEFGSIGVGTTIDQQIEIHNTGTVPRRIELITLGSQSGGVVTIVSPAALPVTIPPGDSVAIVLRYGSPVKGELTDTLKVKIGGPCGEELKAAY
ncbi:MAG: choice-of-anchor D domain-containing protein, partial [Bacteroidota bacterium]